jgi:hypothetical protein
VTVLFGHGEGRPQIDVDTLKQAAAEEDDSLEAQPGRCGSQLGRLACCMRRTSSNPHDLRLGDLGSANRQKAAGQRHDSIIETSFDPAHV